MTQTRSSGGRGVLPLLGTPPWTFNKQRAGVQGCQPAAVVHLWPLQAADFLDARIEHKVHSPLETPLDEHSIGH